MSQIVWLASYPKSGSTWLRAFLTHYIQDGPPASLDRLVGGGAAVLRSVFEDLVGAPSDLIPFEHLLSLRRQACLRYAAEGQGLSFLKVHDAFARTELGESLFPASVTRCAVYLVRNPLDVAVSYAHHRGRSIDETIALMASPVGDLDGSSRFGLQLPQRLSAWSEHVDGWLDQREFPVITIRFEDLVESTAAQFGRVLEACGLPVDVARLQSAVEWSSFDNLRSLEEEHGFFERPSTAGRFFRAGRVGGGAALTTAQRSRVIDTHGVVMARLGYQ